MPEQEPFESGKLYERMMALLPAVLRAATAGLPHWVARMHHEDDLRQQIMVLAERLHREGRLSYTTDAALRAWLGTAARNVAGAAVRRERARQGDRLVAFGGADEAGALAHPGTSPSGRAADAERRLLLRRALARLQDGERDILVAHHVEARSLDDIVRRKALSSRRQARKLLDGAHRALRLALAEEGGTESQFFTRDARGGAGPPHVEEEPT